jgi:RNA polymerase sigma-70 factor, ECF subfamily
VSAGSAQPEETTQLDRRLLVRLAAGDGDALGDLYDRYATTVFTLAVHIVRDHAEAEEVVQETFTQAWRQAARYDPLRATVAGWLVMMARSRAIDRVRSRSVKPDAPGATALPDLPSPAPGQDALALSREAASRVREALQQLGDTLRAPLELAYFEGLSQAAIAERLHQPLGTIKTRMRTALSKLREALQSEGAR